MYMRSARAAECARACASSLLPMQTPALLGRAPVSVCVRVCVCITSVCVRVCVCVTYPVCL